MSNITPEKLPKPELSQFKKMCDTTVNVFATTVFATGVTFAASATIYNTYVGKQEMKEVPTIISNTIEDNLKEQGFTGGIYDKMKGIQADGGACAPLAQDLRTDYNARVNGVFDKVYDTVSPKYVLEFGTSYDIYAKKNAKRYTDEHMKNAAIIPVETDKRYAEFIPEAKPEQVNEMITRIRSKAAKLEECVINNPKIK